MANFYLTTWEEFHTGTGLSTISLFLYTDSSSGQLFLGVFSGPVEGIIIIVAIYAITGFFGKYVTCPFFTSRRF